MVERRSDRPVLFIRGYRGGQRGSPRAGWNLVSSKKAANKWRLLSCRRSVVRSMIQNGYRSSISHPPTGAGEKDKGREAEGTKHSPVYGFDDS